MSLIVKIILLGLSLVLSLPASAKTQCFVYLCFNSTLQLINGILSNLKKLRRYFNDTAIVTFFRVPLSWFGVGWATVFPIDLVLYSKDLKLLSLAMSASKLVASSLESNYKLLVFFRII